MDKVKKIITVSLLLTCIVIILYFYYKQNVLTSSLFHLNNQDFDGYLNNKTLKNILLWNSPNRVEVAAFGTGHQPFIDAGCPVTNCFIKANSTEFWRQAIRNDSAILKSFDAVVINVHDLWLSFLPEYERPSNQRLVWLTQESPMVTLSGKLVDGNPKKFERIFNWTMTYKRDSDIQFLYGRIHPISNRTLNTTELREERRSALANKTGTPVAWMVSHCETESRREDYVDQLKKNIQVDIYGKCGSMSCPRSEQWISNPECYDMIGRQYKFYLSFENSFCNDYVTEKFFSILQLDVVPVVFGSADYQAIAPNNSYINALAFSSPAKLAEYLHLLDGNEELYLDYLEWKSDYIVEAGVEQMTRHGFCDLCAKLNRKNEPGKIYDSMVPHWAASTQCRQAWNG